MADFLKPTATGTAMVTVLSAIAAATVPGRPASAACSPLTSTGSQITITCDTAAPNPESGSISTSGTDITFSVLPGAIYLPDAISQSLPDGSTILNRGRIVADFDMGDGATVINEGEIFGLFALSNADDTVTNSGMIDTASAGATTDDEFLLRDGDDTFTLVDDGVVSGLVDGGVGTDTLRLEGTGSAGSGSTFTDFEELVVADGSNWSFAPVSPTFDTLTVGASSLTLPNGITATTATIAAGGSVVFDGTSAVSGITSFGAMAVEGTLTVGSLALEDSGSLSGSGSIVGSISSSGTLSPGSSIGTLAIDGSLLLESGSTTQIEFTGDPVTSDQILVSGTTTIEDGATLQFVELGDSGTGSFDFLVSDGGITGNFTTVEGTLIDLTRQIELVATSPTTLSAVISLADGETLISDAPYNPVNGSPSSLLQDMSSNDFWSGVDAVGGTEINFDYTSLTQDGVDIDVFKLPIRHTFELPDTDMRLVVQAPFSYATIEGDTVYSQQIGTALRIPVFENWELTPAVRVGGVYSDDFSSEAVGFGGAVTSRFQFMLGDYTVQIGNHVGYYRAEDVSVFLDDGIEYNTQNVLLRNGIIVDGAVPMFGGLVDVQAFAVDTRNFGDDLFVESYVDIGASANLSSLIGYPVRFGAKGTFGEDTTGFSINTGYRF